MDVRNPKQMKFKHMMHICGAIKFGFVKKRPITTATREISVHPEIPYLKKYVSPGVRTSENPYLRKSVLPEVRTSENPYLRSPYLRKSVHPEVHTSGNRYLRKSVPLEIRTSGTSFLRKSVLYGISGLGSGVWGSIFRTNVLCMRSTCLEKDFSLEGVVFLSIRSSVSNNEHMLLSHL